METIDENKSAMANKAAGDYRPTTSRVVLGEIPVTNNVVEKLNNKTKGLKVSHQRPNAQVLPKKNAEGVRPSKVPADKVDRPSAFQIFCDSSDSENNFSNNEVELGLELDVTREEMESCEETDHLLSERTENSLALEEVIHELDESEIHCEETIDFESDEELDETSVSDRTSEANRSFNLTTLSKCKEYANEIHKYLLYYERKAMADPFYIAKQPEINAKMRSILVDWLVEVTEEYKLLEQTLFLAVNYIDRSDIYLRGAFNQNYLLSGFFR